MVARIEGVGPGPHATYWRRIPPKPLCIYSDRPGGLLCGHPADTHVVWDTGGEQHTVLCTFHGLQVLRRWCALLVHDLTEACVTGEIDFDANRCVDAVVDLDDPAGSVRASLPGTTGGR
jgi:hypothetical protein